MHLNCPECRAPIFSEDIELVKTIAKCKSCHNIFDFQHDLSNAPDLPGRYRKEIVIPPGIEVLHLMNELEIMIKWRRSANTFTLSFALLWNAIIGVMVLFVAAAGELTSLLFLSPFIFVGIYLVYASIGYFLNTTFITVDDKRVAIEHKPINFLIQKDHYYTSEEVDQVFVKKYSVGSKNEQKVYAFAVDLILKNGKNHTLIKQLHSIEYARYIEQEIEHYLKIKDRSVDGEYSVGL